MSSARSTFASILPGAAAALIALAGLSSSVSAQTRFDRFYDSSTGVQEVASSVEQTTDHGYIMVGTRQFNANSSGIYAIKTGPLGGVLWAKTYGLGGGVLGQLRGSCVRQTRDGGYIMAGVSSVGAPNQLVLIKTDPLGNIQWQRTYRGGNNDADTLRGPVVRERNGVQGGYVVVSNTRLPQGGIQEAGLLLRVDAAGNLIDENYYLDARFGGNGSTAFRDVRQDADGSFVIVGTTYWPNGAGSEALVFKTLPNSPFMFGARAYGPATDFNTGESTEITTGNTGYAFTGHRGTVMDTLLFKTTPVLNPVFNRQFNNVDTAYSLRENVWHELISTGFSNNIPAPMFRASTLMKNGFGGNYIWSFQYLFGGDKTAAQGVPTDDGGYAFAGSTAFGPNPFNVALTKTNAAAEDCDRLPVQVGQPGWQPQITPIDLITVPFPGMEFPQYLVVNDQPVSDWSCLVPGCTPPPRNMVFWAPFDIASPTADLAGGGAGVAFGAPTQTPGYVGTSMCFNTGVINSYVDYPNSISKNFGLGDFSFDAWVRRPNTNGQPLNDGVRVIVDKRSVYPNGAIRGYSFYLFNGNVACQIASGPAINYSVGAAGLVPPDGQWHHVAATVRRSGAGPEVLFYRDGAQVGASVPVNAGNLGFSVNCPSPLRVGARIAAGPVAGSTFQDCLDEIEIFNRALGASEISNLYTAQSAGKCREACFLPTVSMCPTDTSVTVSGVICNYTTSTQTYTYSLQGQPVGPGCNIAGPAFPPTTFGPVTALPGQCIPVSITIPRPFGLANGLVGCWQMCVQSGTGNTFCCSSKVVGSTSACFHWAGGGLGSPLRLGVPTALRLDVSNDSSGNGIQASYRIRAIGPDMEPDTYSISLNGLPPGEPVIGTLRLPSGGTASLNLTAQINIGSEDDINPIYNLVVEADLDGDGEFEPIASQMITTTNPPPCPADFNLDGAANSQDFFDFITAFFALDPSADVNNDGSINSQDFFDFVRMFFNGCN